MTVEFYWDFGSPTSYLAWRHLPKIVRKHGATIEHRPVLLGGIFKATGNQSPVAVPAKGAYMGGDLARFARRYGVAMQFNPHFPINTLGLMRGAWAARELDCFSAYSEAVFDAMWRDPVDLGDVDVVRTVLSDADLDADAILERAGTDEVKQALKNATAEAVERGLFGLPTFFVGGEMFWGQDRLDFVDEALANA